MSIEWTAAHRAAWESSWAEPHMQAGLLLIRERLWPKMIALPQGYDALVIAAAAHNTSVGHSQVFDEIEKLKKEHVRPKPLPDPNTLAARGIESKRPE